MKIYRSRAPLRLGLAGGGTDVDPYSSQHGGRVLNVTIDRYAYASVEQINSGVEFSSPDRQVTGRCEMAELSSMSTEFGLHVAVYRRVMDQFNDGADIPLRLSTQVDAPPGSGLGSSSALVVAMVLAITDMLNVSIGPYELARISWEIERVQLGMAGGWQDQYAAAFGGFNYMESRPGPNTVIVNPLRIRRSVSSELEASLLLYFGGVSRNSSDLIEEQSRRVRDGDASSLAATHAVKREAEEMKDHLLTGDIARLAASVREGWTAKKKLAAAISNPAIEQAYKVAARHGMIAGKVSGAGGGGFMMLIVDPERRMEVERNLKSECNGLVAATHFTEFGAEAWRTNRAAR